MKRFASIFVVALVLNFIWENAHSVLYTAYKGGEITELILFRASLFDAFVITLFVAPFIFSKSTKYTGLLIFIIGTIVAIFNEWYGLNTARWAYNSLMPIIPLFHVGLTPAIQLGILGYATYGLQRYINFQPFFLKE